MCLILGIRIGFYYDLFTEACINDRPTEEKLVLPVYSSGVVYFWRCQPSHDYESFRCFFLFFFMFHRKKLEVKYQGGKRE